MKKTNKKYIIILALVTVVAIGGIMISRNIPEQQEIVQVENSTEARIDLLTPYAKETQFIVYGKDSEMLQEASWMPKFNIRGYVLQQNETDYNFVIGSNNDVKIKLVLRGPDKRDDNNNVIENWVDFTSVTINGEEILPGTTAVWHNKPFTYVINAKAGETYTVSAKWQKHKESAE